MKILRLSDEESKQHGLIIQGLSFAYELESEFEFTSDPAQADVIVLDNAYGDSDIISRQLSYLQSVYSSQLIVIDALHHCDDFFDVSLTKDPFLTVTNRVVVTHLDMSQADNGIYYDFIFNYTKAAYTDWNRLDLNNKRLSNGCGQEFFILTDIQRTANPKKFLSPNRIYYDIPENYRVAARIELKNLLQSKDGYLSDPFQGVVLEAEVTTNDHYNSNLNSGNGGNLIPVANRFYNDSFASIYVESITQNPTRMVTEKTFIPLIKGHFIIPFSYSGFINDLKTVYNFQMPTWIDYSYDTIQDHNERKAAWLISVQNYLNYSTANLFNYYYQDKGILDHNRSVFYNRPYDSLFTKLTPFL